MCVHNVMFKCQWTFYFILIFPKVLSLSNLAINIIFKIWEFIFSTFDSWYFCTWSDLASSVWKLYICCHERFSVLGNRRESLHWRMMTAYWWPWLDPLFRDKNGIWDGEEPITYLRCLWNCMDNLFISFILILNAIDLNNAFK